MDKLRSLVNPGKATDDEVMYGSGRSEDPVHSGTGLTGEGSHLQGHTRNAGAGDPISSSSTATGAAGQTASQVDSPAYSAASAATSKATADPTSTGGAATSGSQPSNTMSVQDRRTGVNDSQNDRAAYSREGGNFTSGTGTVASSNNPYSAREVDPRLGASRIPGTFPEDFQTSDAINTAGESTGSYLTESTPVGPNNGASGIDSAQNRSGREFPLRDRAAVGSTVAAEDNTYRQPERERDVGHPTGHSASLDPSGSQRIGNTDHRYGHDTATTGATAMEAEQLHHHESGRLAASSDDTANTVERGYGAQSTGAAGNTDHRYGRDAAAIGTAAVAGEGIHHHRQHEREGLNDTIENTGYQGTTASGANQHYHGAPSGTALASGPHSTRAANVLDPSVNTQARSVENPRIHHPEIGGGGEAADKDHGSGATRDSRMAPATGTGMTEYGHQGQGSASFGGTNTTGVPGRGASQATDQSRGHPGRDVAAAGVGAGLVEHEDRHHFNERGVHNAPSSGVAGAGTAATGAPGAGYRHVERDAAIGSAGAGLAEHERRNQDAESRSYNYPATVRVTNPQDARSRAVPGHAGIEGAGVDESHVHGRGSGATEPITGAGRYGSDSHSESKREQKAEDKEARREAKEEKKHHGGGLLGFLHRDKNKKYTKEEEEEFDRQEQEQRGHVGRDAAIGGAAGAGVYEAEKHHHQHTGGSSVPTADTDVNKPLPTAPGNHGVGTGEGTRNALANAPAGPGHDGHYASDMTAAGGAASLPERERSKHDRGVSGRPEGPPGTDLGDKLHGVDRYRGVNTAGNPTGDSVHDDQTSAYDVGTSGSRTGAGVTTQTGVYDATRPISATHHIGRDAAIGAGATGLAGQEYEKHQGMTGTGLPDQRRHQAYNTSMTEFGTESNTGYETGTGQASGTPIYDQFAMNNRESGQVTTSSGAEPHSAHRYQDSGVGLGEHEQPKVAYHEPGLNKLHKNPPASHPAARGGVTDDGTDIEPVTGRRI